MKFILNLILIVSCLIGFAQQEEVDTTKVLYRSLTDFESWQNLNFEKVDLFQNYRIYNINSPLARLGNLGLAIHYLDSMPIETNIASIAGAYSPFLKTKESLRFYNTKTPFTSLNYVTGAEQEQQFTVLHTQNFGERLNISFEYQRITSEGFYSRQLTNHTMFNGNYTYSSFNKRFSSYGYYSVASLEALENGGIIIGESENPDDNTVLLDINLTNAQNQIRNRLFGFINEYKIFNPTDSTDNISIGHELEINRISRNYDDLIATNGDFYFNNYIDNEKTLDTSFAQVISNEAFIGFESLSLQLGFKNSQFNYFQNYLIDDALNSNFFNASIDREFSKLDLRLNVSKGISGYHKEEFDLVIDGKYQLNSRFSLNGMLMSQVKRPNPLMNMMRLNHFFIENDLENIELNQLAIGVSDTISRTSLQIQYSTYQNFVYYNQVSIIRNYSNSVNVLKVNLKKLTKINRLFNLYTNISIQSANVNSIIPIPTIVSYNSFFFSNSYFENSLNLQLGADFYFVSDYLRSSYNPALVQFYRDNNEDFEGSVMQLDLFLNLAINKGAKVFFKFENLLEEPFSEDSYRVQGYAIPGRAMKIGISWRMLN